MEGEKHSCPECGKTHRDSPCEHCGYRDEQQPALLRVLPPAECSAVADDPRPPTPLVREFKGPTIEDLLDDVDQRADLLPGQVRAVLRAIDAGDFAEADRRFDAAVGSLLPGPGFRRRQRSALFGVVVGSLFFLLLAATLLALL